MNPHHPHSGYQVLLTSSVLLLALFFSSLPAFSAESLPGYAIDVRDAGTVENTFVPPPAEFHQHTRAATATLIVTYHGFTPEAQAAFQYAVDIWETLITSPVPIRIDATWTALGPGILGSCGPTQIWRDFAGTPQAGTWFPVALANARAGVDLNPNLHDITAQFSSAFSWYLGTDGNCPGGQYDFVTVVLHELGHGLGFLGTAGYSNGIGSWGSGTGYPMRYDRMVVNGGLQYLMNTALYPNPSIALGSQLTSNNLYWTGGYAYVANGNIRPKLYAPATWNGGSSYAHWDEATYVPGNANSLMTPFVGSAEAIHTPGPNTMGLFKDLGWTAVTLAPQPDMVIRNATDTTYTGDNLYSNTGSNQVCSQYVPNTGTATYYIRVYNDGVGSDTYRVAGTASDTDWTIRYYYYKTSGWVEITSNVIAANGWLSPSLDVGYSAWLRMEVTPDADPAPASLKVAIVIATSQANLSKRDAVQARTYVRKNQPDIQLRPSTTSTYIGDNIYKTVTGQTATGSVAIGQQMLYYVRVYNDGNVDEAYRLTGWVGATGYHVRYYYGATEITAQMTGGGWTTPVKSPGQYTLITLTLSPDSTIGEGGSQTLYLYAYSTISGAMYDYARTITAVYLTQPDWWVRNSSSATYLGDNIYNTTGVDQTATGSVARDSTILYYLRAYNDGNIAQPLRVFGWAGAGGCHVVYKYGATDITALVTSTGWVSPTVASGGYVLLTVTLTPDNTISEGSIQTLYHTVYSMLNTAKRDVAKTVTTVIKRKSDMWVRNSTDGTYLGNDVYNTDGTGQTKSQYVRIGGTVRYFLRIQNDGNVDDSFKVTGWPGAPGYHVRYWYHGATDTEITSEVTGAGWVGAALAPGASHWMSVTLSPDTTVNSTVSQTLMVYGTSLGDTSRIDAVKAVTVIARDQPDGWIRKSTDAAYLGDGIYNVTGTGQTATQIVAPAGTGQFNIVLQNDSNTEDSLRVTGWAGTPAWHVRYYDASSGAEITSGVTGAGWLTGSLAPQAARVITVTMTPDSTVTPGSGQIVYVSAYSIGTPTQRDVVKAIGILQGARPDAMIRSGSDAAYLGNDIYNSTGAGQTRSLLLPAGSTATYVYKLQNDGTSSDMLKVAGTAGDASWQVYYYTAGDGDITAQVTGGGWTTPPLLPGATAIVWSYVISSSTLGSGSTKTTQLTATSSSDATKQDVVKAETTVAAAFQPDLSIRVPTDAGYLGNDIYNSSGTGQSRTQTVSAGVPATYVYRVQNDGNATDVLTITGAAGTSDWTIRYFVSGLGEVTTQVVSTGWTTPALAPGASFGMWCEITPSSALTPGTSASNTLNAVSSHDVTKKDVVMSSTTVGP